jgi:hypothetical protein
MVEKRISTSNVVFLLFLFFGGSLAFLSLENVRGKSQNTPKTQF